MFRLLNIRRSIPAWILRSSLRHHCVRVGGQNILHCRHHVSQHYHLVIVCISQVFGVLQNYSVDKNLYNGFVPRLCSGTVPVPVRRYLAIRYTILPIYFKRNRKIFAEILTVKINVRISVFYRANNGSETVYF